METTTKLAIGVSALCCLATAAFAGGPEVPMIDMNGINVGLGFGYKSYTWDQAAASADIVDGTPRVLFFPVSDSLNQFGPLGELGYTYAGYSWVFGVKGQFEYDNVRVTHPVHNITANSTFTYRTRFGSHVTAMLLAGLKVTDADVVYLEGGYTALWGKTTVFSGDSAAVAPAGTAVSTKYTLNGGIAGVGYRHYFMNNVFLDVSYDYALYKSKNGAVGFSGVGAANTGVVAVANPKRVAINGITATANYLFNI